MKRLRPYKLDVVLTSGAVIRLHVTEYTVTRDAEGSVTNFKWSCARRHRRNLITLVPYRIDAVVRVSR